MKNSNKCPSQVILSVSSVIQLIVDDYLPINDKYITNKFSYVLFLCLFQFCFHKMMYVCHIIVNVN